MSTKETQDRRNKCGQQASGLSWQERRLDVEESLVICASVETARHTNGTQVICT